MIPRGFLGRQVYRSYAKPRGKAPEFQLDQSAHQ